MEYMKWENIIFDETGVTATVILKGGQISLRTKNYADYILAKNALKDKTSHPIMRDVFHMKP